MDPNQYHTITSGKGVRGQSPRKKNPINELNASISGMTHNSMSNRNLATALVEDHSQRKPSRFELTTALYGEDETILAKMSKNARYTNSTGKQIDREI